MSSSALSHLNKIEASLWEAADQLRAHSKLTSSEYCMPVLGVIFLRQASNRYDAALAAIQADQEAGLMPRWSLKRAEFEPLRNQLPKEHDQFDPRLLEDLLRAFDTEALRRAPSDMFGRIYEYFLMKFAMPGAQDNGELLTPPSLVQMTINVRQRPIRSSSRPLCFEHRSTDSAPPATPCCPA